MKSQGKKGLLRRDGGAGRPLQVSLEMLRTPAASQRRTRSGRHPAGPAIALLRIAARHPRIIRENVENVGIRRVMRVGQSVFTHALRCDQPPEGAAFE